MIITNHPYLTGGLSTHMPDLQLIKPYFHDGAIIAFGWDFIHSADIGGGVPSSISPRFNELFQAAAAFSIQGYLIDPDTISEVDALEESLEEVEETGARLWMVALGSEPPGGATDLAEQIFQFVVGEGTVVVIAPESIGWASDRETWTEGQLDDATKTAFEGGSYDEAAALFFAALET